VVLVLNPLSDAVEVIVPVAALPPETVVPRLVVVPYSNLGVVDVPPVTIVPFKVAVLTPTDVGLLVVIDTVPTAAATLLDVQPPLGRRAASSLAACSSRSAAIVASESPAALDIS
jgi:hypothetical protein